MDIPSLSLILLGQFNYVFLVIMLILVLLSAFFSMSETALNSCNRYKLENDGQNGRKTSQKALWLLDRYDWTLTTILVGNNIVNIALATISVAFFAKLLESASYTEVVSTAVITVVVLIFGEILPKTIAKAHANSVVTKISYILYVLYFLLSPIVVLFYGLQKIMKHHESDNDEPQMTEEQLNVLLDTMEDEGSIEHQEVEVIKRVLYLNDKEVKDIMTPRVDIVAIDDSDDIEDIKDLFVDNKYSRIPVYHEDKDHIVGILYERDFMTALVNKKKTFRLKSLLKEPKFVSGTMKVDDLIQEMKLDKVHIAMVSGEYGEVIGLVTLEDALEELVGEIYDEHDDNGEELIHELGEGEYSINTNIFLTDLFEKLDLGNPPKTSYTKLSGWLYSKTEDLPEVGTVVEYVSSYYERNEEDDFEKYFKKLTFTITEVEERRATEVNLKVQVIDEEEAEEFSEDDD